MTETINIGGIQFAQATGDVKRAALAARAAAEIIEKRARKAKDMPLAVFQINAASQLIISLANGLRDLNPEWHHNFLVQLINALVADPAELQRLADNQPPKPH